MAFKETIKKYQKTIISGGFVIVVCIVALLAGYSVVDIGKCALTMDFDSLACLAISGEPAPLPTVNLNQ